MPKHVSMDLEGQSRLLPGSLHHPIEAVRCKRCPTLVHEYERRCWCLPLQSTQDPQFVATNGVRARFPVLRPTHMHSRGSKVDLRPFQSAHLARAKTVPVGDKDHG